MDDINDRLRRRIHREFVEGSRMKGLSSGNYAEFYYDNTIEFNPVLMSPYWNQTKHQQTASAARTYEDLSGDNCGRIAESGSVRDPTLKKYKSFPSMRSLSSDSLQSNITSASTLTTEFAEELPRLGYPQVGPQHQVSLQAKQYERSTVGFEMSRGGRGGARGGMLKGATWEHDASLVPPNSPSALFPVYKVPVPGPVTEKEKKQIKHYIELREQIHQGPLYTQPSKRDPNAPAKTYGEDQFAERYGVKSKADIDPFVGVPTYSQKYEQKKRVIPQLSGRPFNKELFPKELWSTLEGEEGEEVRAHINRAARKKALILSGAKPDAEFTDKASKVLEKIMKATENEDEDMEGEEEAIEEDYDYEEDEDEMGGDYDGEQYFDGGENDEDDGGDNAGGDDY